MNEITQNRAHGYYPFEDSIGAYGSKVEFPLEEPQISVVHDFRIAVMISIAREDDALNRRQGGLGLIFHHPMTANTPLPEARAGAAVYFDALTTYCSAKGLDPKKMLMNNGTSKKNTNMFLEYASHAHKMINDAIKTQ